ncbi:hypothetical protein CPB83DRAFT_852609, partial [Crepidotus variabilis]
MLYVFLPGLLLRVSSFSLWGCSLQGNGSSGLRHSSTFMIDMYYQLLYPRLNPLLTESSSEGCRFASCDKNTPVEKDRLHHTRSYSRAYLIFPNGTTY